MSELRLQKVMTALRREFPTGDPVRLVVGLSKVSGNGPVLIFFQQSEDVLETPNSRQTRTIGVSIVAVAENMDDSMEIMKRAVRALEDDPMIRIFDRTGMGTDVELELPGAEGMCMTSQRIDLR